MPRCLPARRRQLKEVVITEGQGDLLTEWRQSGKITDSQFATFTRTKEGQK
ncbi:hypothetical protein HKX69_05965 [Streptomyces argyrophyllae]|uniref:Uncharacterized protein n=1 Tax=Streptomyces argyrophylli TaxID=2726118 RepID=A0A6M4PF43_9ACTN|nr:hypothetical protein [Streptomyces argyrophyllae]QJS09119.1 hypothetical protein HKX69_05965 [Streptomyces argyrophyllae]